MRSPARSRISSPSGTLWRPVRGAGKREAGLAPDDLVTLDEDRAGGLLKLLDALDENEDVQNVYANFDISESVMAALSR